ncbi:Photosystem II PsbQ, oxygen evolving complex [Artemisia annua]|uniref:Photosystem II PsbQ, oxygen evolving complex n=1 Tax=Artemisia annua TaxID=35608 RepID=A0A2U1KNM4_ARTAN|nr:Photosystem II PsbQ, oxygen evolving complex [Artemisia annua]
MSSIRFLGTSQAASLDLSGSARLNHMARNSHSITTHVVKTEYKHDEKAMSRRVVLKLITTSIASGSFAGNVLVGMKRIKACPAPPSGGLVKYHVTSCHDSSSFSYYIFPIFFIDREDET